MSVDTKAKPRLFRLEIRQRPRVRLAGKFTKRTATFWIKAPYGAAFNLAEVLQRAMSTDQIVGYAIYLMTPKEIAVHRGELIRWQEATERLPGVDWSL